jgi:transcriptional regulator with XRE-family HTH domain
MKGVNDMKREDQKNKLAAEIISVANLPPDFTIKNPKSFIAEMRVTFLRKAREAKKLTLEEVSKQLYMPLEEMSRIESGKVNAQDMMILHELANLYGVDYHRILALFKLAEAKADVEYGIAACHKENIDKETQDKILDIANKLRDQLK